MIRPLRKAEYSFFSAHPKRDPDSGELFNIGLKIGLEPTLEVYKCSANRSLMKRTVLALTDLAFVHDFAITRKHVILIIPPWSCSTTGLAKSLWKGAMAQFFEWKEDAGTRLIVLKRSDLSVAPWRATNGSVRLEQHGMDFASSCPGTQPRGIR